MRKAATDSVITVRPANEASWDDLQKIFGRRGFASRCRCQRYKIRDFCWAGVCDEERMHRQHEQAACGDPSAPSTSGLVAYVDGEPAGWCAVEPRCGYERLRYNRVPWTGRAEDKMDPSVWAVTCFFTGAGYRRLGVASVLARSTVAFARERGARAVEGYPMTMTNVILEELHVGTEAMFAEAGYKEVSRPSARRVVMRVDF
jgi:GNAT superfamily N-acetyltransferase